MIVTLSQIEAFLSPHVALDVLDDDGDGTIDTPALTQIAEHAEATVMASLRGLYELPLAEPIDPLVTYAILSVVHARAIARFPERFRAGLKVAEDTASLLRQLRTGELQISHPLRSGACAPEAASHPPRNGDTPP